MTLFILYCLYDYHRSVFLENEHFSLLFRTRPHTEALARVTLSSTLGLLSVSSQITKLPNKNIRQKSIFVTFDQNCCSNAVLPPFKNSIQAILSTTYQPCLVSLKSLFRALCVLVVRCNV